MGAIKVFVLSVLISFTIIGLVSLLSMRPPNYIFYWYETNNLIRAIEIAIGLFSILIGFDMWYKECINS